MFPWTFWSPPNVYKKGVMTPVSEDPHEFCIQFQCFPCALKYHSTFFCIWEQPPGHHVSRTPAWDCAPQCKGESILHPGLFWSNSECQGREKWEDVSEKTPQLLPAHKQPNGFWARMRFSPLPPSFRVSLRSWIIRVSLAVFEPNPLTTQKCRQRGARLSWRWPGQTTSLFILPTPTFLVVGQLLTLGRYGIWDHPDGEVN